MFSSCFSHMCFILFRAFVLRRWGRLAWLPSIVNSDFCIAFSCRAGGTLGYAIPRLVSDDPREPSDAEWPKSRGLEMICYSLTFMALVFMLANVVKVKITLIEFLPFYVVFIIWKGWRYVGVKERNVGLFMIMETAAIVGSVYLWSFFLNVVI